MLCIESILKQIHNKIRNETNLTYRPFKEIKRVFETGDILYKIIDDEVVSFIFKYRLPKNYIELGAWYCDKKYRNNHYASQILKMAIAEEKYHYLLFTYNKFVKEYSMKLGFIEYDYKRLPFKVKLKLILNRLELNKILRIILRNDKSKIKLMLKFSKCM